MFCHRIKNIFFRSICLGLVVCFLTTTLIPREALGQGVFSLPASGALAPLNNNFTPVILRGLKIYPDNPFKFDFIVDSGDTGIKGTDLKSESEKLIRYFLASLAIPESDFWVNLSPYENDRIIPDTLGQTEMGRDMLAQDYILKQITASLTNPDSLLGKEFWARVYRKAYEEYGSTNIPVDTFNKVWIIPEKAVVYEDKDKALVAESYLKVMLESDYLAEQKSREEKVESREKKIEDRGEKGEEPQAVGSREHIVSSEKSPLASDISSNISTDIVRELVVPEIEKEVNEGKNFAQLRQVCHSLILAYWFKTKLKNAILNKVYTGKAKIKGVDLADKDMAQKLYGQYLETFQKGVYSMIKVERDPYTNKNVPRKYFSGGEVLNYNEGNTTFTNDFSQYEKKFAANITTTYQATCRFDNSSWSPGSSSLQAKKLCLRRSI